MKPIFLRFLDELEVQYTTQYATSTHDEHPYKHTIYGLSSMLDKYSVFNVALNLNDKEEFLKLQPPFMAQVTEDIVIVKSVSNEFVKYNWRGKYIDAIVKKFKEIWSGIITLTHPSEDSIKPEYHENERNVNLLRYKISIAVSCEILSLIASIMRL